MFVFMKTAVLFPWVSIFGNMQWALKIKSKLTASHCLDFVSCSRVQILKKAYTFFIHIQCITPLNMSAPKECVTFS
jgi:hypothetical protein